MKLVCAALVKAQAKFSPALKTNSNPHFKSKYADLSACVEAVIDALNESGIALVQKTHECDGGVMVETLFVHESGEIFEAGKLNVPAIKSDPQGYGSALTYARRYSLMAACGIAPEDDDGNAAAKKKPVPQAAEKPPGMRENEKVDYLAAIASAESMSELQAAFAEAYAAAKRFGDKSAATKFTDAKDKRKGELQRHASVIQPDEIKRSARDDYQQHVS